MLATNPVTANLIKARELIAVEPPITQETCDHRGEMRGSISMSIDGSSTSDMTCGRCGKRFESKTPPRDNFNWPEVTPRNSYIHATVEPYYFNLDFAKEVSIPRGVKTK